MFFARKREAT